jgi:hypothetical protein
MGLGAKVPFHLIDGCFIILYFQAVVHLFKVAKSSAK